MALNVRCGFGDYFDKAFEGEGQVWGRFEMNSCIMDR